MKIIRIASKLLGAVLYYFFTLCVPKNKKLWVFGSWKGKNYSDNSKALFEYVNKNHKEIEAVWIAKNEKVYDTLESLGYKVISYSSIKAKWIVARAGANIQTESNEDTGTFRVGGTKVIQLFHGYGAVKEAYLYPEMSNFKKMLVKIYADNHSNTYWMVPSEYFVKRLPVLFEINPNKAYITGQPRIDVLFENKKFSFFEQYKKLHIDAKMLLYAPTHRNYASSSKQDFTENDWVNLNEFCKSRNYILFFKPHPLEAYKYKETFATYSNLVLLTNGTSMYSDDVYDYMHYFDLLISDYSSISTDYLVFDRPIVHFMYDMDSFENKNFTLEALNAFQAGPICKTWDSLFLKIEASINNDAYKHYRDKAKINAFKYIDKNNCERVYKQICKILKLNDEQE